MDQHIKQLHVEIMKQLHAKEDVHLHQVHVIVKL
jgi:hypothetical protein